MSPQTEQLLRYLDGEMSADEAERFRATLAERPELRHELEQLRRVGACVRGWASRAEVGAAALLEPTLMRVRESERKRTRRTTFAYGVAATLLLLLPWTRRVPPKPPVDVEAAVSTSEGAAIERLEAGGANAQVFVLGAERTPVVWLVDDPTDDDTSEQQGPG